MDLWLIQAITEKIVVIYSIKKTSRNRR
jgi:hypothetical protein